MRALCLAVYLVPGTAVAAEASPAPVGVADVQTVDLNQASTTELMQLPGVGQKRALDIINYRTAHPFRRPTELLKIRGIGQRTYARLKAWVRVADPSSLRPRDTR